MDKFDNRLQPDQLEIKTELKLTKEIFLVLFLVENIYKISIFFR